jgi:serine/threonine protein kinase
VDAKYDVLKQIGSGAYGVVVSAKDVTSDHKYAIKKVNSALSRLLMLLMISLMRKELFEKSNC